MVLLPFFYCKNPPKANKLNTYFWKCLYIKNIRDISYNVH